MSLVLDSSVALKWYLPEILAEAASYLRKRIESEFTPVAVPQFFFVEAANILWKKTSLKRQLSRNDAKGVYSRILDLPFRVIQNDDLLLQALDLSISHSVSVYDGLYLACALYSKSVLVTADTALVSRLAASQLSKHVVHLEKFA